ncbi:hypothetical protein [Sulfurisphaera ohwakuensis]|uniref:Membrane protein implicated in regulation of membrane protease activity n=1 Tax=Sulfurisphaera ohwakuensis TaxID=69656 RepID=A0A650CFT1_SULOH|nr:hypothetical protein [Sulfurisphaera ohwakuensis]MBB5254919.1 membrane protein implicated in regulation of membrane protease activity [Sulfurisphaera ohwakuensis]QGR16596.1 hypothetical protein D1869_04845 [Sulfurisphaera ohwakuensis]
MDNYYEKILRKYVLLIVSIYLAADISFIVLTSFMSLLMKFLIFIIVTVIDILISYRLILNYNVYFFFLIPSIIGGDILIVSVSLLPTLLADLTCLFMFLIYLLALAYFMTKYKPKIYDLNGKWLILNIIYFILTLLALVNLRA